MFRRLAIATGPASRLSTPHQGTRTSSLRLRLLHSSLSVRQSTSTSTSSFVGNTQTAFKETVAEWTKPTKDRARLTARFVSSVVGLAGAAFVIDKTLNAETEILDGSLDFNQTTANPGPALIKSNDFALRYLRNTYGIFAGGALLAFGSAYAMVRIPRFANIATRNPAALIFFSLLASGGLSNVALAVPRDMEYAKEIKMALFSGFTVSKGVFLSSLLVVSPPLLVRAGLAGFGLLSSMALIGGTTKSDNYVVTGGTALGLATTAAVAFNFKALPPALYAMPVYQHLVLYPGLALFYMFALRDVEKVIKHANEVYDSNHPWEPTDIPIDLKQKETEFRIFTINEALLLYRDLMTVTQRDIENFVGLPEFLQNQYNKLQLKIVPLDKRIQ
ncbi:hypothetical protein HDU99_002450 [Rhizoclosmatium hyalinum]|nr:hypothetical protein HDU99_002450 [Rhizoclosmatium hyalinum]